MTSDDTINEYIREAIELIINDKDYYVIKADQNKPRKNKPYCTVKITASKSMSLEEYSDTNSGVANVNSTSKVMRNIRVSFDFFKNGLSANDPFYYAGLCRQALARQTILSKLNGDGLGLATRSQVKNMTHALDNGFEERANFIATFNYVDIDSEELSTIDSVAIGGNYQYKNNSDDFNIGINK